MTSRQLGFNKFDFLVVVSVVGVMIAAFLGRMEQVQAEAEQVQVELTIRNIRLGMQLAVGELVMQAKDDEIRRLATRNPLSFLEKFPEGFEGERSIPSHPGGWVYDPNRLELIYQPKQESAFNGRDYLRWRFQSISAPKDRLAGLRLSAVD